MAVTFTVPGLRWAVDTLPDEQGFHLEGRVWLAAHPSTLVLSFCSYVRGGRADREAIRSRVLALYRQHPQAVLANGLGETIRPGG